MANRDPVVPGPDKPQQRTPLQWTPLGTVSREERWVLAWLSLSQPIVPKQLERGGRRDRVRAGRWSGKDKAC